MKKLIAVFLLAILVFAFAACESEQEAVQYLQRMIENAEKDSEDAESWTGKEDPEAELDPVVVPDEPLGSGSRYIPQITDLTPLKPTSVEAGEIIGACRSWSTLLDKEGTPGDRVVFFYDGTGAYMEKPLEAFAGNTERSIRWTYDEDYGFLIITAGKESWSYSFFEADGTIMLINNGVDSKNFKGPAYFMQDEEIIYTEPKGKADGNYSGFYVSADDSSVKILIHGDGTITLEEPATENSTLLWKVNKGKIYLAASTVLDGEEDVEPTFWYEYDFDWDGGTIHCDFFGSDLYFWGTEE